MAKFLDQTGLQVVWEQIKAKFVDKTSLVETLGDYATLEDVAEQLGSLEVERLDTPELGYAASYKIVDQDGNQHGETINIPKDFLVKSAELKVVETADTPYEGAVVGDKYIDFVVNSKDDDAEESHIYLPVNDLVDTYTAGDGISISANNEISVSNRTVQTLNGPNGKALVWNESDGGGVKFEHNDGTWSFTGVNDGGKDGITGQIYSVDHNNGNKGTRLNMTNNGFFYTNGATSGSAYTAKDEIATKGDVEAAEPDAITEDEIKAICV